MFQFTKATKATAKLRLAIFGPSGAGKTFTSLRLATGMGGKIAVIDSERGSASKYADRFVFDTLQPPKADIETYVQAIQAAGKAGYDILIVDSLTHAWQELLGEVDRLANAKYKGNTWSAWSEGTPKQRQLVDALLAYPGHLIATMRTKTEWTSETDRNGRVKPVRVGLAPEQGKGIEYEFDMLMEITPTHVVNVIKDRTGLYQDKPIAAPDEALGRELVDWLNSGAEAPPPARPSAAPPPAREYTEAEIGPDFDAPLTPPSDQPSGSMRPGPGMWKTWREVASEAAQLNIPLPSFDPETITARELSAQGKALRDRVTAAKAHAQPAAAAKPSVPPSNGSRKPPTREELVAYVRQLGEEAKRLNIVGPAWTFNPNWSDADITKVGKDLKARLKQAKEPTHA